MVVFYAPIHEEFIGQRMKKTKFPAKTRLGQSESLLVYYADVGKVNE